MASSITRITSVCAIAFGIAGCASSNPAPQDPPPQDLAPKDITPRGSATAPPQHGTIVTADDIDRAGPEAIEKTLATKIPGISVSLSPDGSLVIRVRSQTSIMRNTEPLYVIDGMEVQPGPGGGLLGINPHDIATIEVLKDAASLSFYGVRAANGVILIKTKQTN